MQSDDNDNDDFNDSHEDTQRRRYHRQDQNHERPRWRILDTVVRGENAAVEVSILELEVPRYSFRVGTAHFPKYDGDPITVSPRLTIFNVQDAADLLADLASKYLKLREDKIDEVEARKERALTRMKNTSSEVEVLKKRNT
jgi:hypothetical protein